VARPFGRNDELHSTLGDLSRAQMAPGAPYVKKP